MRNISFKAFFVALVFFASACSALPPSPKTISVLGDIEIPLPLESGEYWIDDGPLFVASKDPLITYRVIDKDEIEFSGSKKSVYDFIRSSFNEPSGVVEQSFFGSHKEYGINHKNLKNIDFYILNKDGEAKVYMVSKNMDIGVEVSVIGSDADSILNKIINGARLVKGE